MTGADILDLVILVTLFLYVANGFMSGFIIQGCRLFSLVGAFWAVRAWTSPAADWLTFISSPAWRSIMAAAIILTAVLIGIGILGRLLKKLVSFSFGGWIDRICGALLALVVGLIFWTVILLFLHKLFPGAEFLRDSRALPYFDGIFRFLSPWLPQQLIEYLNFN